VIQLADKLAAFRPGQMSPLMGAQALKGHGFSRAAKASKTDPALAAKGIQMIEKIVPQGLKPGNSLPCLVARLKPFPFKAPRFTQPLRFPLARTPLMCLALSAFLAAAPGRADTPPAKPDTDTSASTSANHWHDSSMQEYRNHLLGLTTLVEACSKARDAKTCDPAQVGPDDRVPLANSPGTTAPPQQRLIRYGWLRVLLSQAQDKDKADTPAKSVAKPKSDDDDDDAPAKDPTKPCDCSTTDLLKTAETRLANDLAQTDSAIPPTPAHTQERDVMKQVLSGRDFRNLQQNSVRDTILEKIETWLNRILQSISKVTAGKLWIGRLVFWGFIVAVCVALIWGLMQLERRWRIRLIPEVDGPGPGAASARDWQLWLEDARQAAAAGLWREAIHYVYWASISRLESWRLWPADRARTPREYLALMDSQDPRKAGLAKLTGSFERFWYGGRSAAQADYLNAEQLANALIAGVRIQGDQRGAQQ